MIVNHAISKMQHRDTLSAEFITVSQYHHELMSMFHLLCLHLCAFVLKHKIFWSYFAKLHCWYLHSYVECVG